MKANKNVDNKRLLKRNIIESNSHEGIQKKTNQLDVSLIDEFSSKKDIIECFMQVMPNQMMMDNTLCSTDRILKIDEFFSFIMFDSINSFFSNILGLDKPFFGSYEPSDSSLIGLLFDYVTLNNEHIEVISYIAPIIFKNYSLFEKEDVLSKNAKTIKNMMGNKKVLPFINEEGHFTTLHHFAIENEKEILEVPKSVIGEENWAFMAKKIEQIKKFKNEIEAFHNVKDNIISNKGQTQQTTPVESGGKKTQFISQQSIDNIKKEAENSFQGDAEYSRLKIIEKSKQLEEGISIKTTQKEMLNELEELKLRFPNFVEVIDYIKGSVSLSLLKKDTELNFEPFLMLGSPGLGKTVFAKELSRVLDVPSDVWAVSQFNQSFTLTGLDLGWASGKPGKIFNFVVNKNIANPVIVLDEIDKTQGNTLNGGDINSVFLQLFEKDTAKEIKDEAIDAPMDASLINWVCTANDVSEISQPLLSRLKIFNIQKPNSSEMPRVIDSVFKNLLDEQINGGCFHRDIPKNFYKELSEFEPRKVKKILKDVMMYSAEKTLKSEIDFECIYLDDLSLKKAIQHEPRQRHKNMM